MSSLRSLALLARPQQWTKNLLVLAALLFAAQLQYRHQCLRAFMMFLAFCCVSSAVYAFNDVLDRVADQSHPRKRNRPVASGSIRPWAATAFSLLLLGAGAAASAVTTREARISLAGYLVLQIAYSTVLKHLVILDVMSIAMGFVLRAVAGAFAIEVQISPWLLICTILLALFLALSKRRSELVSTDQPALHRHVLGEYNLPLIDQLIGVVASGTILAYTLYAYSEQTSQKFPSHLMPLTLPFVLYGIFRYLYLIYRRSEGGEPEMILLRDFPFLVNILLWALVVVIVATRT